MNQKMYNQKRIDNATKVLECIDYLYAFTTKDERRPNDAFDIDNEKPIAEIYKDEDGKKELGTWSFTDNATFEKVMDAISNVNENLSFLMFIKKKVENDLAKEMEMTFGEQNVQVKQFSSYEQLGVFE